MGLHEKVVYFMIG